MKKIKVLAGLCIVFLLLSPVIANPVNVSGQGQEVCPGEKDGWIKIDGLTGCTVTLVASEGCLIDAYCYKYGTNCTGPIPVVPPQDRVVVDLGPGCAPELSHASFHQNCQQDPTPTPTDGPVDPTPTPTDGPVDPTPTPTDRPVDPTPTPTDGPVDPTPTPTDGPVDPTPTPTDGPVDPTPTQDIIIPPTGGSGNAAVLPVIGGTIILIGVLIAFFRRKAKKV